jgi:hypothetical protein
MADEWEAECPDADLPPDAAPDLPNDSFGAKVSAMPSDAINAAAYIRCFIGLTILLPSTHSNAC